MDTSGWIQSMDPQDPKRSTFLKLLDPGQYWILRIQDPAMDPGSKVDPGSKTDPGSKMDPEDAGSNWILWIQFNSATNSTIVINYRLTSD